MGLTELRTPPPLTGEQLSAQISCSLSIVSSKGSSVHLPSGTDTKMGRNLRIQQQLSPILLDCLLGSWWTPPGPAHGGTLSHAQLQASLPAPQARPSSVPGRNFLFTECTSENGGSVNISLGKNNKAPFSLCH